MNGFARLRCLTILLSSLVVGLLPCQAWSEGQWEITNAYVQTYQTATNGPFSYPPFSGSDTQTLELCTQSDPNIVLGDSGFVSEGECDIAVSLTGNKTINGVGSYSGGMGRSNDAHCWGEYYFTWEDDPPSTSPGVVMAWQASGNGTAMIAMEAGIYGTATAYSSANADHQGGGSSPDHYYEYDNWPGGEAYACGYINMNTSTTSVYSNGQSSYTPEEYGEGGGSGRYQSSWPTDQGDRTLVDAYAIWRLYPVEDSYWSDPGVAAIRMDSRGGCYTYASVSLSVGNNSTARGNGGGHALGTYGFDAQAYARP